MKPTTSRLPRWLQWVVGALLVALFLTSAVAKLMAIDDFELYIYSYGFFSLNFSYVVARLCIAAELVMALALLLGWWERWAHLAVFALLVLFSLFLCYAALVGRTDSCQCMGRLADLNPAQSLLKNALLILLVLLYRRPCRPFLRIKRPVLQALVFVAMAAGLTVAVFCISVPDSWMFGPEEARYDKPLLAETIAPDGALGERQLTQGHHLVAFVTPGCPYCRMTREKLGSIIRRNDLDSNKVLYVEPDDIGTDLFLRITYGQRPFVVMLDDGAPVITYHYRNISEKQVTEFLR